jgi:hypothetical protein
MTDDRFTELLNGALNHPRTAFFMLRLANALRSVVQRCDEAGDAALEAHRKELDELYHMRMNRSRMKRRGERYTKVCGGAGVNQYDNYTK